MMKPLRFAAVAVAAATAVVLAGCGPSSSTAAPGSGHLGNVPTSAGANPGGPSAPATVGATAAPDDSTPVLPDGRSPVIIKSIDVAKGTVTFDLIEFYAGLQAEVEWKKDHPGQTDVPPLDGHYIRNNNTKLRTLPVSANAVVKVLDDSGDPTDFSGIAFDDLPGYRNTYQTVFWITVKGGAITLFEEQFFS
jgi:hypothetical protein